MEITIPVEGGEGVYHMLSRVCCIVPSYNQNPFKSWCDFLGEERSMGSFVLNLR